MSLSTTAYVNIGIAVLFMTIALLVHISAAAFAFPKRVHVAWAKFDICAAPSQNPRSINSNASSESADDSSRSKSLKDPLLDLHDEAKRATARRTSGTSCISLQRLAVRSWLRAVVKGVDLVELVGATTLVVRS
ncbi:predicted protein [Sclerotinia sclerotiorum 1980 UF-70]|uniref:Uncharacterized protein n=1 Tax=Sclerotinia sclerotiorum (strain ATCC 18683 / 1980 / Ss-1) TaxID=665079 RepID=A7E7A4_SCLS1|nr:predicted protein [Sclerotinia sclerotiorum 1980 UF-70]EDN96256.1 predicted protein [Sclerotinia sclerotiorum 1980 UF-70]